MFSKYQVQLPLKAATRHLIDFIRINPRIHGWSVLRADDETNLWALKNCFLSFIELNKNV